MNTFDNATVHPHRYFSSVTWKEVDKPLTTTNDELFYDLLDGKKHIDGECRPCKFLYNRNEFNPEFDYEVEPFPGFIECYSHIELDAHIAQSVAYLNQKGYKTDWCCEGHMNADTLRKGVEVEIGIGFQQNCVPDTTPNGFELVKYKTGLWTLRKLVIPGNKYKCLTSSGNRCYRKGATKLTDEEYDKCVNFLLDSYEELEDWASKITKMQF